MPRKILEFRYLLPVYIILLVVMFLLPYFSADGYSVFKNTTSQLGAQNAPNAWVMNMVFFLLGAACILEAWLHLRNFWFQKVILTIFGLGLIFIAFFQHAPITGSIPFNSLEDEIHSFFANVIGFAFTILAFSAAFITKSHVGKIMALLLGCISTILSALMFSLTTYTGILQRLMFILAFAWLIFFFEEVRTLEN